MNIRKSAIDHSLEPSQEELGAIMMLIQENPKRGNHLEIGAVAGGGLYKLLSKTRLQNLFLRLVYS